MANIPDKFIIVDTTLKNIMKYFWCVTRLLLATLNRTVPKVGKQINCPRLMSIRYKRVLTKNNNEVLKLPYVNIMKVLLETMDLLLLVNCCIWNYRLCSGVYAHNLVLHISLSKP